MYLQKIHIENYRLLTNIDIFLDRVLTLIVGKNNTGKTSVINLIRKVLNEEKTLSIDDYPLECRSRLYDVIEKYWAGEIDQSEVKQQIAESLSAGKTVKFKFLGTGMISVMPVPLLAAHPRECSPQGRTRYVPSACACRWTCQVHLHRPP